MRFQVLLSFLLVLITNISPLYGAEDKGCTISGQVSSPGQTEVQIGDVHVPLETAGRFSYTLKIDQPTFITLTCGQTLDLYLVPGKSLHLTVDSSGKTKGVAYSGDLAQINRCWTAVYADLVALNRSLNQAAKQVFTPDAKAFLAMIAQRFAPIQTRLGQLQAKSELERSFIEDSRQRLLFAQANWLLEYPDAVRYFAKDPAFQPPQNFYAFINQLPIDKGHWLQSEDFRVFIDRWVSTAIEAQKIQPAGTKQNNFTSLWRQLSALLAMVKDPAIRDFLLQKRLLQLLNEHYSKDYAELAQEIIRLCRNHSELEQKIDAARAEEQKLEQGVIRTVYKTIGAVSLEAFIYLPTGWQKGDTRGCVAFFHGGGWTIGSPHWGDEDCRHFAQQGLVAISFEYRLISVHGTTPVESMRDARSALRWTRQHAREYGIDPARIAALGFSAGGHLAAATASISGFDEPSEDAAICSTADALLLWSAPVRFTADSDLWFAAQLKEQASLLACSPYDHLRPGDPPAIMFQGAADNLVSPQFATDYADKMKALGNRCDLHLYEGQGHLPWPKARRAEVLSKMDTFLAAIGFMKR